MRLGSGSLRALVGCCIALAEAGCSSEDSSAAAPSHAETSSDARAFVPEGLVLESANDFPVPLELVTYTLTLDAGKEQWLVGVRNTGSDPICDVSAVALVYAADSTSLATAEARVLGAGIFHGDGSGAWNCVKPGEVALGSTEYPGYFDRTNGAGSAQRLLVKLNGYLPDDIAPEAAGVTARNVHLNDNTVVGDLVNQGTLEALGLRVHAYSRNLVDRPLSTASAMRYTLAPSESWSFSLSLAPPAGSFSVGWTYVDPAP